MRIHIVVSILLLLSMVSFSHAFFGEKIIEKVHHKVRHRLGVELPHKLQQKSYELIQSPSSSLLQSAKNHSCNECIRWTAHHVINETVNAIVAACSNTTCPIVKKQCEWMETHVNFTIGYLVGKLHPVGDAFLYCAGAGRCPIHPNDSALVVEEILKDGVFDDKSQIIHTEALGALWDGEEDSHVKTAEEMITENEEQDIDDVGFAGDDENHDIQKHPKKKKCVKCLRKTVLKYVKTVFKGISAFCEKAKDEKWKQRCEFTFSHRKFSAGYITAKFNPGHFATGYCLGKKACRIKPGDMEPFQPVQPFSTNDFEF